MNRLDGGGRTNGARTIMRRLASLARAKRAAQPATVCAVLRGTASAFCVRGINSSVFTASWACTQKTVDALASPFLTPTSLLARHPHHLTALRQLPMATYKLMVQHASTMRLSLNDTRHILGAITRSI